MEEISLCSGEDTGSVNFGLIESEVKGSDCGVRKEEINVLGSITPVGLSFWSELDCKLFPVKELNRFPTEEEDSVAPIWTSEAYTQSCRKTVQTL